VVKTQGSDTKLVGQMQPYYEAKGLSRRDLGGTGVPPLVTQIADGENGGVMMNEFPPKYFGVIRECSGTQTPAMNVTEYLERLRTVGIGPGDLPVIQPLFQSRIWGRMSPGDGPGRLAEVIGQLHEYKRQFLKLLYVVTVYNRIKADPAAPVTPCTVIFGAKAAPRCHEAKRIIKLINSVAAVINADPDVAGRIRVAFLPDYNVSVAELVVAAGNVSEQISLAGKEASGTGNMKLALNGAVTVGTLDGANIEIRDRVGPGNFFLFGLTAGQAVAIRQGGYSPRAYYRDDAELRAAMDALASATFSGGDPYTLTPVIASVLDWDEYLVLADYRSYVDCHDRAVGPAWADEDRWTRMSILNTARSGYFSSDRTVRDYCRDIWHAQPAPVPARLADPEVPPPGS